MVVWQGFRLTVAGVLVGLVASFAATRLIAALLINVRATDLVTFIAVPIVLTLVALGASHIPALRATRIDPIDALRMTRFQMSAPNVHGADTVLSNYRSLGRDEACDVSPACLPLAPSLLGRKKCVITNLDTCLPTFAPMRVECL